MPSTSTCPSSSAHRLDSTSPRVRWPLPSTPATPTISPACTSRSRRSSSTRPSRPTTEASAIVSTGSPSRPAGGARRLAGSMSSTTPNAACSRRSATSRPTIARASVAGSLPTVGRDVDDLAVAHDRDLVAGRDDLGELVADEGDGLALVLDDAAQRGEQELRFGRREHRRRLVEHEDLRVAAQALDDLDPLAHAGGQVGDAVVGIDLQAVLLADLADAPADARRVEPAGVAERDVLPHRQRLDQAEVLVDHGDAAIARPRSDRRC